MCSRKEIHIRKTLWGLLVIMIYSCSFFENENQKAQEMAAQEIAEINWNKLDKFPVFESCMDSLENESRNQKCFQEVLTQNVLGYLDEMKIKITLQKPEILGLELVIQKNKKVKLDSIYTTSESMMPIAEIKSHLEKRLKTLPVFYPATKRGQAVDVKMRLPILLKQQ